MDRQDYWVRKEAEIGETVEATFYCTYLNGDWSVKGPQTGVLFFRKSTLYFQSFSVSTSLESLFQPRRRENISESHSFNLPMENLHCTFDDSPQTILSRLFAAPEQFFDIHQREGERDAGSYRFSVDRKKLKTIVDLINSNHSGVQG
ncbi:MAG: hypothetical protein DRQ43_11535 [Gammaproteobacteria bacterium]|nr:MAG: hypothetical protein DRQ43_11535 [Gammaproteobacteria bacterium]